MVDVDTMNNEYQHPGPVGNFTCTAGKFGCDVLELLELQAKLLKADTKRAMVQSQGAVLIAIIGSLCLAGCVPILILGVASAITYYFDVAAWVSQLAVSVCFAIVSVTFIVVAMRSLSKTGQQFRRSTEELSKNIEWAKDLFSGAAHR